MNKQNYNHDKTNMSSKKRERIQTDNKKYYTLTATLKLHM